MTLSNADCGRRELIPGGCDNPFGKLYRLTIGTHLCRSKINFLGSSDPTVGGTIEVILEGSVDNGGAYDNVLATKSGKIILLEDPTPTALSEIFQPASR